MTLNSVITHRAKPFYCSSRGGFLNAFLRSFKLLYKTVLVWKFTYTDVNKINTVFAWRMTYEAESSYQMVLFSFLLFFVLFKYPFAQFALSLKVMRNAEFFIRSYWFVGKKSLKIVGVRFMYINCYSMRVVGSEKGFIRLKWILLN